MFWFELLIIFLLIFFGARVGDVFMGLLGGVGVAIFVFLFKVQPASPPVDVMLIILAVVLAASALQSSGGLNFLVKVAEKMLHRSPKNVTIVAPVICWLFTFLSGTGHVVYSLLPIINKLAIDSGIRPERPISNSIIASQQAITCSPVSAATAAMLGLMAPFGVDLGTILIIAIPSTLLGVIASALLTIRKGKELADDPEYLRRLAEGLMDEGLGKRLRSKSKRRRNRHPKVQELLSSCSCSAFCPLLCLAYSVSCVLPGPWMVQQRFSQWLTRLRL